MTPREYNAWWVRYFGPTGRLSRVAFCKSYERERALAFARSGQRPGDCAWVLERRGRPATPPEWKT